MPETRASEDSSPQNESAQVAVATLAGGCFWCTEAVFELIDGVGDVISGYIGGQSPDPNYREVCTGQTGHAEAVEVHYDPKKRSYDEILEVFFRTHDPTSLNRQGLDEGTQYRSAVFYHDEKQKELAENCIRRLEASGVYNRKIVTTLEPATRFFRAEDYHQDYYRRNPNAGYCQAVVRNKVIKTNQEFGEILKKS